jgi:insulysin
LARKDHPLNAFSTGNIETLGKIPESRGTNIRDLMIEFYNKHYSANLMRVAIYGSESLDQLEKWAVDRFSPVPNKEIARLTYPSDPFGPDQLQKVVQVVPVRYVINLPSLKDLVLTLQLFILLSLPLSFRRRRSVI